MVHTQRNTNFLIVPVRVRFQNGLNSLTRKLFVSMKTNLRVRINALNEMTSTDLKLSLVSHGNMHACEQCVKSIHKHARIFTSFLFLLHKCD